MMDKALLIMTQIAPLGLRLELIMRDNQRGKKGNRFRIFTTKKTPLIPLTVRVPTAKAKGSKTTATLTSF